jgi:hypothetical protein
MSILIFQKHKWHISTSHKTYVQQSLVNLVVIDTEFDRDDTVRSYAL